VASGGLGAAVAGLGAEAARGVTTTAALLVLVWAVTRSASPADGQRLLAAWGLRILFGVLYVQIFHFTGAGDVIVYHQVAAEIAGHWRHFEAAPPPLPEEFPAGFAVGTKAIFYVVAAIYTLTGDSIYAGQAVFATLGLGGAWLFCRAFRLGVPAGDQRLYRDLVLFYPSVAFWTSGLGKDPLVALANGMLAYGGARLYRKTGIARGFVLCGAGVLVGLVARPHATGVMLLPLIGLLLLRGARRGLLTPIWRTLGIGGLLAVGALALVAAGRYLGFGSTLEDLGGFLRGRYLSAGTAASTYEMPDIFTPGGVAEAVATTFLRPFPWEAHTTLAALASLETLGLVALLVWNGGRILRALAGIRRNAYVGFAVAVCLLLAVLLAAMSLNFGTLVRQRAHVLPFLFMLVAFRPGPGPAAAAGPVDR
jgi:hypothetical protein